MQPQNAIFPSSRVVAALKRPHPRKEFGDLVTAAQVVAGSNPALPTNDSANFSAG